MEQNVISIDDFISQSTPAVEATPQEDPQYRITLIRHLHEGIVTVTFTKADGTLRVMQATLNKDLLPKIEVNEDAPKKEVKPKKESTTSIPVFDTEIQAWRAITWNNIVSIELRA
jgi:hypothetical protein